MYTPYGLHEVVQRFPRPLSGAIPAELGDLADTLTRLRLSNGNGFTGCVPAGLADVEDNDLDELGLEVCAVP